MYLLPLVLVEEVMFSSCVCVCESYVVQRRAVVHHRSVLCTMVHKGDLCVCESYIVHHLMGTILRAVCVCVWVGGFVDLGSKIKVTGLNL